MSKKNQQDFEFETEIKLRNRIAKEYSLNLIFISL